MLVRIWGNWIIHTLLVGIQTVTVTLDNSLAVSYKTKHMLPYDSATAPLGIHPSEMETQFI